MPRNAYLSSIEFVTSC